MHNSGGVVDGLLDSVPATIGDRTVEIHAVDSGSSDGTVERLRLDPRGIRTHVMDGNRGFAAGINHAVRALAERDVPPASVVIVNPDVRFGPGTAERLVGELYRDPRVGIVAPRLLTADGELQLSLRHRPGVAATWSEAVCGGPLAHRLGLPTEVIRDRSVYESVADVGWATGGFLAVSWDCLSAVGEWDESYFLYEEEVDFCLRAGDRGYAVRYLPDAVAIRLVDASVSPWIRGLMRTNRVRHVRNREGRWPAASVRAGLLAGDLLRVCRGRADARAGAWTLARGADVDGVLRRYRPDSAASLPAGPAVPGSSGSRADAEVEAAVRAFATGGSSRTDDVPALLDAARRHGVLGVICDVVAGGEAGARVRREHTARALQQQHSLHLLGRKLDEAGVDWLVLKGPVLSEIVYRRPGVREYADLDVLVRPADFERAVDVLVAAGSTLVDGNWPMIRRQQRGELSLIGPGGVVVDLHWHVINDPQVRSELALDTGELFGNARTVRIGGAQVRTLDEVDTVVHTAVHAWKSGGDRLRWLLDVQQAALRVDDGAAVRERARALGVELPVSLMLRRAAAIGPSVARAIGTGAVTGAWLALDRALTPLPTRGHARPGGAIVLRAARDTGRIRTLVRTARAGIRHRAGHAETTDSKADLHRSVEHAMDRAAYHEAVRAHGTSGGARAPHVLVIVENLSVPFDRRVWQQSSTLVRSGYRVTVICPMGARRDTEPEVTIDGVRILRYPLRAATGGPTGYLREYGAALWHSARLARKVGHVDVVHACNPPDLLLLVGLPFKLLSRAKLVFDHHDLVPELFESRFGSRSGLFYRAAVLLERATFAVADGVISTNESYREVAIDRGHKRPERVRVVRSAPDLSRFVPVEPDPGLRRGRRHLLTYLGVMGPQDGVDYALRAIGHLRDDLGCTDVHVIMMGAGDALDDMVRLRDQLGLAGMVEFPGRVSDEFLRTCLSTADVCLAPDPLNPLNDVSTMNKIVEYMAMSRPIVSFDLKEARVSAGDAADYAEPNDEREFAGLIRDLLADPERRRRMGDAGRRRVEDRLSWERSEKELLGFYRAITGGGPTHRTGPWSTE
ncbi:nucleotidyltransferase family protein [Pseudonocardia tropica]|uniref:Nucleotidyltransferase family protein n=1 Tax=Pseudonocardia tropica TaxID=681289 RepID=A0ABV1JXH3_9PSEU